MIRSSLSVTAKLRAANAAAAIETTITSSINGTKRRMKLTQLRSKSSMASLRLPSSIRSDVKRVVGVTGSSSLSSKTTPDKMAIIDCSNNNRRRQQHQLVVSTSASSSSPLPPSTLYPSGFGDDNCHTTVEEEEHRRVVAMRLFLDSLQLATANSTLSTTTTAAAATNTTAATNLSSTIPKAEESSKKSNLKLKLKKIQEPKTLTESDTTNKSRRDDGSLIVGSPEALTKSHTGYDIFIRQGVTQEMTTTLTDDDNKLEDIVVGSSMIEGKNNKEKSSDESKATGEAQTQTETIKSSSKTPVESKSSVESRDDFDRLKSALRHSIYHKDLNRSLYLFRESQRKRQILPRVAVTDLFFMVSQKDPISAYNLIQYYNTHYLPQDIESNKKKNNLHDPSLDTATNKRLSLYKRISNSISLLNPHYNNTRQMHVLMDSLLHEIEEMDMESKRLLYPNLVVSLVAQRSTTVGQYASNLYQYMVEHEFEMKAGWLNRLLSMSRYNRQDDVPFHDVIARLVDVPGGQLNAEAVLPAIQNMFPFTDMDQMCVTLEAWLDDFRTKHYDGFRNEDDEEHINILNQEDLIDLSTLETISTGAAQAGCSKLILLVWDVLESCHYRPTEMIYENTVVAFANERGGLQQAFAAMASMKEDGFEPSRPLIRSFSSAIRLQRFLIGKARRMLTDDKQNEMASIENNKLLSLETLNVILSSYAERGDPRDAVEILDVMSDNEIQPNADSYSFVIEALGRDIKKRLKTEDHSYMQRNVEIADTILSMMEGNGTAPTTHVIRHYVELLCLAGESETATSIAEDFLSSEERKTRLIVNNITIYRVATENAALGNFETAKKLASMMTEYVPALHRRIKSREQRALYVEKSVESSTNDPDKDSSHA